MYIYINMYIYIYIYIYIYMCICVYTTAVVSQTPIRHSYTEHVCWKAVMRLASPRMHATTKKLQSVLHTRKGFA